MPVNAEKAEQQQPAHGLPTLTQPMTNVNARAQAAQAAADADAACVWPHWAELVDAARAYATLTGWRFTVADFMSGLSEAKPQSEETRVAKAEAMPMALEFADRIKACLDAATTAAAGEQPPLLIAEFGACQRLVAAEAVYNSMVATLAAVGLGSDASFNQLPGGVPDEDAMAYQDMTQPIEVVAARLAAHAALMERSPEVRDERRRRLMHASFIVEFGLAHGLPELSDETSEEMLRDFLRRLGEWEGGAAAEPGAAQALLGAIPEHQPRLKRTAAQWIDANRGSAFVGGAIVGGIVGVLAASAVVALASSRRR